MVLRNDGIFFKLTGFIKMVRLKIYTDVVRVACMLQAFQKIGLIFTEKYFFFKCTMIQKRSKYEVKS